jgi:hypothetical protein
LASLGKRVKGETDHFGIHDSVLIKGEDNFLHLLKDKGELRVDVECV